MRAPKRQHRSHPSRIALLAAACALASCAHGAAHKQTGGATEAPAATHESGGLQLNAGQKWKANAETTEGALLSTLEGSEGEAFVTTLQRLQVHLGQ